MILLSHAIDDSNEYRHIANCADVCDLFTASLQTVKPFGISFGSVDVGSTNDDVKSWEATGGVGVLLVSDEPILIQVGLKLEYNILLEEGLLDKKILLDTKWGLKISAFDVDFQGSKAITHKRHNFFGLEVWNVTCWYFPSFDLHAGASNLIFQSFNL